MSENNYPITQEDYNEIEDEFGDYRFNQYCILVRQEDGGIGIFGEFQDPKDAADYYKYFLSHAVDEKDVPIQMLTMVSRLNDKGDAYQMDMDFMTHKKDAGEDDE